jgi:hypothetical protein
MTAPGNLPSARSELDLMKRLTHDLMEMTLQPDWCRATEDPAVTIRRSRSESRVDHFSQTSPQNSTEESSAAGQKRETEPPNSPALVRAPPVDVPQQRQQRRRSARGDTLAPTQPVAAKYTVIPIKVDVNIKFRPKSSKTSSLLSVCSDNDDDDKIGKVSERDQVESDGSGQHEQQADNLDVEDAQREELKTENGDGVNEACVVENNDDEDA